MRERRNLVIGLPLLDGVGRLYEGCVRGKQHRDSFPDGKSQRAHQQLQLVHTDICGPMQTISHGGSRYFLTFTDDYSRKTWVYLLKQKSEAFDKFKEFKAYVENQSGHRLTVLRSDRGGEYVSNAFSEFCKTHGIKHQLTASYTPQQNGVSERKNRTIVEMARSMITNKNFPKVFWAEAVYCAVYILNRCPTKSVLNMTPEEAWSGYKPDVTSLRIVGCVAYAHVPDEKRQKLDDKGEKCIFLGYSDRTKGYKLFNPTTNVVIISRDVTFSEDECWDWTNSEKTKFRLDLDNDSLYRRRRN